MPLQVPGQQGGREGGKCHHLSSKGRGRTAPSSRASSSSHHCMVHPDSGSAVRSQKRPQDTSWVGRRHTPTQVLLPTPSCYISFWSWAVWSCPGSAHCSPCMGAHPSRAVTAPGLFPFLCPSPPPCSSLANPPEENPFISSQCLHVPRSDPLQYPNEGSTVHSPLFSTAVTGKCQHRAHCRCCHQLAHREGVCYIHYPPISEARKQ